MNEVLATPDWLLVELKPATRQARFLALKEADYAREAFLYPRYLGPRLERILDLAGLLNDPDAPWQQPATARFIHHVGYCGSTLLTRLLEAATNAFVLREPRALLSLSVPWRRFVFVGEDEQLRRQLLRFAWWTYSRTYRADAQAVVKLQSSAGNLMAKLAVACPGVRGIFLSAPFETYVCQVLKSEGRRQLIRARAADLLVAPPPSLPDRFDVARLSDGECAALVWLIHHYALTDLSAATPGGVSVGTIDLMQLLEQPQRCLQAVSDHLGLTETGSSSAVSNVLSTHAKEGDRPFSPQQLRQEVARIRSENETDVLCAEQLRDAVCSRQPLPSPLPGALLH